MNALGKAKEEWQESGWVDFNAPVQQAKYHEENDRHSEGIPAGSSSFLSVPQGYGCTLRTDPRNSARFW